MEITMELRQTTCWCGTPFMLPARLLESAQNGGHTIHCPHGHTLTWKETEVDRLRRERDRLKQDAARLEDERREAAARADRAEKETKKIKKRANAGVCQCCNRTFLNVQRHMKTKHPNVIPLEQKSA